MAEIRTYGWMPSMIDESIVTYTTSDPSDASHYNREATMPVINQGVEGSCVSQTCYELYGYYAKQALKKENDITPTWVYRRRSNKPEEGMMCRDAFEILQREGKIQSFALVRGINAVKHAILTFGGVLLAVKVYNETDDFWEGSGKLLGGHAICALGYDDDYLYFKNSWGYGYGRNGRWKMPLSEFKKVMEVWAITG